MRVTDHKIWILGSIPDPKISLVSVTDYTSCTQQCLITGFWLWGLPTSNRGIVVCAQYRDMHVITWDYPQLIEE